MVLLLDLCDGFVSLCLFGFLFFICFYLLGPALIPHHFRTVRGRVSQTSPAWRRRLISFALIMLSLILLCFFVPLPCVSASPSAKGIANVVSLFGLLLFFVFSSFSVFVDSRFRFVLARTGRFFSPVVIWFDAQSQVFFFLSSLTPSVLSVGGFRSEDGDAGMAAASCSPLDGGPPLSEQEPSFSALETRRVSLKERRSGTLALQKLSMETISEISRERVERPEAAVQAHFLGWHRAPPSSAQPAATPAQISSLIAAPPLAVDSTGRSLKVMSYNVLAERYVSTGKYSACPTFALEAAYRYANILNEICEVGPDIISFQEMTGELHKGAMLGGPLHAPPHGYESFHVPITNKEGNPYALAMSGIGSSSSTTTSVQTSLQSSLDPSRSGAFQFPLGRSSGGAAVTAVATMPSSVAASVDNDDPRSSVDTCVRERNGFSLAGAKPRDDYEGVAIFFRASRFVAEEHIPVKFNQLAARDPLLQMEQKKLVSASSHNVAAISVLKERATGAVFIVATIHSFWDPSKSECQLYQLVKLLECIEEQVDAYEHIAPSVTVILCGDMNATPQSVPVKFLRNGVVPAAAAASATPGERVFPQFVSARHNLRLRWTYEAYQAQFPSHLTSVNAQGFSGVMDYIFVSDKTVEVAAVGALTDGQEGMPGPVRPSDHLPVSALLVTKETRG